MYALEINYRGIVRDFAYRQNRPSSSHKALTTYTQRLVTHTLFVRSFGIFGVLSSSRSIATVTPVDDIGGRMSYMLAKVMLTTTMLRMGHNGRLHLMTMYNRPLHLVLSVVY